MATRHDLWLVDVEPRIVTSAAIRAEFIRFLGDHPESLTDQDTLRAAWWRYWLDDRRA